jgi:hypothetical protein
MAHKHEFGMRWDVRVPRNAIRRRIDRLHVGVPETEVETMIVAACNNSAGFTPVLVRQSVKFALEVHRRNGVFFQRVMSGRL